MVFSDSSFHVFSHAQSLRLPRIGIRSRAIPCTWVRRADSLISAASLHPAGPPVSGSSFGMFRRTFGFVRLTPPAEDGRAGGVQQVDAAPSLH
jgi:hypothetical protein